MVLLKIRAYVIFNLISFLCKVGDEKNCLTTEQVDALESIYALPKNSNGMVLYPGAVPLGSEPFWEFWLTGSSSHSEDGVFGSAALNFLQYHAFEENPGPEYDFNFDRDPQRMGKAAEYFNADNPDLKAFRERGGKLLMWHGWADPIVPPLGSIDYYENVEEIVGRS